MADWLPQAYIGEGARCPRGVRNWLAGYLEREDRDLGEAGEVSEARIPGMAGMGE
ncbi:hypothetical protein J31TS4_46820 [Paenibacillus sp. J31TS4]|nr:hypothetical protein J31TS4_46820 [Paenibacillus sp. J31TS4]